MVIPPVTQSGVNGRKGMLTEELIIAMAILVLALIPMAYSFVNDQKACRISYYHAVAMEIVDGEMETLRAGAWRQFKEGVQPYSVRGEAARNLPPGRFALTIQDRQLRLEWLPDKRNMGGKVVRETRVE